MKTIYQSVLPARVIFHFNKAYLTDNTIPMWTIKHKGVSYYVNEVLALRGFKTKNTPDSSHTKGSLQFDDAHLLIIEHDGSTTATIR